VITVLSEDTASLAGLVFAFLGISLGKLLGLPALDGVASVLIGVLLGAVAVGLVYQSKALLSGESAHREVVDRIRATVEYDESVEGIKGLFSLHLSLRDILLNLKVRFRDDIDARQTGEAVDRLERRLRDEYPELKRIFIEAGPVGDGRPVPVARWIVHRPDARAARAPSRSCITTTKSRKTPRARNQSLCELETR
jgi:divalent metal cation (Fe/Co/Zn/Cd) transporter